MTAQVLSRENVETISMTASADYSATGQYCFVKVNTDATAVKAGAGDAAIGVLLNNPISGKAATVAVDGEVPIIYGGTITAGDKLMSDASGHALLATTGGTKHVIGIARVSGVANDVGVIHLGCPPLLA